MNSTLQVRLTEEDIKALSLRHLPEYIANQSQRQAENSFKTQTEPDVTRNELPSNTNVPASGHQPMTTLYHNVPSYDEHVGITQDEAEISVKIVNDADLDACQVAVSSSPYTSPMGTLS